MEPDCTTHAVQPSATTGNCAHTSSPISEPSTVRAVTEVTTRIGCRAPLAVGWQGAVAAGPLEGVTCVLVLPR